MATNKAAYMDGAAMGSALYEVAGRPDRRRVSQPALFELGKRFAGLFGYRDMNTGLDWVQGFTDGYNGKVGGALALPGMVSASPDDDDG